MGLNYQMTKLHKSAAERYRDNDLEDKYCTVKETIYAITYMQYTGLHERAGSNLEDERKSVLVCAVHIIVEMLFRSELATGVRADLWPSETSSETLARRDFINSRVDAKLDPVFAAGACRRSRSLICTPTG